VDCCGQPRVTARRVGIRGQNHLGRPAKLHRETTTTLLLEGITKLFGGRLEKLTAVWFEFLALVQKVSTNKYR